MGARQPHADAKVERDMLLVALSRCKTNLAVCKRRSAAFRARISAYAKDEQLRHITQQQVWDELHTVHNQICLQPLSACVAELRRWQGVQRADHERKCTKIREYHEHEEGSLQWAIFCARLTHDSLGALTATPLAAEQVRVCDVAANAYFQPRTKIYKEGTEMRTGLGEHTGIGEQIGQALGPAEPGPGPKRTCTVRRAAAINAVGTLGMSAASARSTRGLICSELSQTRKQFEHLLSRVMSTMVILAESPSSTSNGGAHGSPTASTSQSNAFGKDFKEGGVPQRARKDTRGSDKALRLTSAGALRSYSSDRVHGCGGRCAGSSADIAEGIGVDAKHDISSSMPLALVPPGKRLPLFPRSMRLSSDCLGWLHASQRSASDMHVYFIVEEMETPPLQRVRLKGASQNITLNAQRTRTIIDRLARSVEVNAVSIAGADLRVMAPKELVCNTTSTGSGTGTSTSPSNSVSGTDDEEYWPRVHLRPASVEHLLAVDCMWQEVNPADRHVLNSCYTSRGTSQASKLSTLYIPLGDGTHGELIDAELGTVRRLRPLHTAELMQLVRIYVIREPQPAAATLALPLATLNTERLAELRTSKTDEVFQHVYCTLGPPGSGGGTSSQCFVLQMQVASREDSMGCAREHNITSPSPLLELFQEGVVSGALQPMVKATLRNAASPPPNVNCSRLDSALKCDQKAALATGELLTTLRRKLEQQAIEKAATRTESLRNGRSGARPKILSN